VTTERVYWTPKDEAATEVNSLTGAQQTVGAVRVLKGVTLTAEGFLTRLAERVQRMAEEAGPEELELAAEALRRAGLLDRTPTTESAGTQMVLENQPLRERLGEMGILRGLPSMVKESSPGAETLYRETTLGAWTGMLLAEAVEYATA
jgi:Fe2+ transport system protein FeoA